MTQGNAMLILDLGNSVTRGMVMFGKDRSGRYAEREFELSNRFEEVAPDFIPSEEYSPDTSTVFELDAVVDGVHQKGWFANGEVQEKELNVAPVRPTALEKKYTTTTTALSFELAVLHAYKAIASMTRTVNMESLDITWDVFVLLPPGDLIDGKDKLSTLLKSVNRLNCSFPKFSADIKIGRVSVLPEGFCAYVATVFDKGQVIRPEFKYLLDETTLILDIGAGTTDAMVVQNNKIIRATMVTINRGGNNVSMLVKRFIKEKHNGLVLADTAIQEGMVTGYIKDGSKQVSIVEYINKAKSEIAGQLVTGIKEYFEETQFPVRSIGRLLLCGGGSMNGANKESGIEALSESLVSYLTKLSPNAELVPLPTRFVSVENADGSTSRVSKTINPRLLNLIGASISAEALPM